MDTHYHKHTRERPYKCTWAGCSYAAARQQDLDTHNRKHTGESPGEAVQVHLARLQLCRGEAVVLDSAHC